MDKSRQTSLIFGKIAGIYAKEFSKPSEYIDEFLTQLPKNGKILDVGCGVGVDAGYMALKGFEVVGVDLSGGMLKLARQKFPQINFQLEDIRKFDLIPDLFDGVLASCSLNYIPKKDIPRLIKKFYQTLKTNGLIYIALQAGKSEEIFINEPLKPDEKLFLNIISLDEIKNLLINAGFYIIKKYEREPKSKEELNFTKLFVIAKK